LVFWRLEQRRKNVFEIGKDTSDVAEAEVDAEGDQVAEVATSVDQRVVVCTAADNLDDYPVVPSPVPRRVLRGGCRSRMGFVLFNALDELALTLLSG
jgi:hypothetical protein